MDMQAPERLLYNNKIQPTISITKLYKINTSRYHLIATMRVSQHYFLRASDFLMSQHF